MGNMEVLFFRQFSALFWKNWIVLSKHKLVSLHGRSPGVADTSYS